MNEFENVVKYAVAGIFAVFVGGWVYAQIFPPTPQPSYDNLNRLNNELVNQMNQNTR